MIEDRFSGVGETDCGVRFRGQEVVLWRYGRDPDRRRGAIHTGTEPHRYQGKGSSGKEGETLHRKNPLYVDGAGGTGNKHEGTQDVTSHRW